MFNILSERPPETISLGEHEVRVNTDFRTWIRISLLLEQSKFNADENDEEAIEHNRQLLGQCLVEFLGALPEPRYQDEAARKMLAFCSCYRDGMPGKAQKNSGTVFSYEHDAAHLYAAFMEAYGIDLCGVSHMHWFTFKALFDGLPDGCRLSEIIRIRGTRISGKWPRERQAEWRQLKASVALPDMRTEEEKERDFAEAVSRM